MTNDNEKPSTLGGVVPKTSRNTVSGQVKNSSLDLLEAIADVGKHPERFAEVCHDWASRPEDVEELESFELLLNAVYIRNSDQVESFNSDYFSTTRPFSEEEQKHSFVVDLNSDLVSVGEIAADVLGISVGENTSDLFVRSLDDLIENAALSKKNGLFSDIFGRDGNRHVVTMMMVELSGQVNECIQFTLRKIELSGDAKNYIRQNLALTNAELDVLQLVLQRRSIQSISELRKCALNTTRTQINSIKRKFSSRSLTDVISSTHEIIAFHGGSADGLQEAQTEYKPVQRNSSLSRLSVGPTQIEYSRYGNPSGRPLIILHSIEYGIVPPKEFVSEAKRLGYCVYVPLRPGFGRSTYASTTTQAAIALNDFIGAMKLTDITLVALSTAAPTALKLREYSSQIKQTVLVNYAFNAKKKIEEIKPVWIKGLLKFGLGSGESFKFAVRMLKGMLKILGPKTFYRKLYQSCDEDLQYLAANPESFVASANLILSTKAETCRSDIVSAFAPNSWVEGAVHGQENIMTLFGSHTHGLELEPIRKSMAELGMPFDIIENSGRNCIYQEPGQFFKFLHHDMVVEQAG